jgi:hypothetical protein
MSRGIQHFGAFGADTAAGDVLATDAYQGVISTLTGGTDAINIYNPQGNNYMITGGTDATTIQLPVSGVDDGLCVAVASASAHAHSVTLPSALLYAGGGAKTTATFAANIGAGILLRAWQGTWHVIGSTGTITYS